MRLVHLWLLFGLPFLRLLNEDAKRLSQKAAKNEKDAVRKQNKGE
jgi:hypothetical protein